MSLHAPSRVGEVLKGFRQTILDVAIIILYSIKRCSIAWILEIYNLSKHTECIYTQAARGVILTSEHSSGLFGMFDTT